MHATRAKISCVRPLLLITLTPISRSYAPANSAHVQFANGIDILQFKGDLERLRPDVRDDREHTPCPSNCK